MFLPERAVHRLGRALLLAGVVLPFAVLVYRAANWQPPPVDTTAEALGLEMVILPEGTFSMGSPEEDEADRGDDETLHEVQVGSFALSRTEITQGQFHAVMGEKPVESRSEFIDNQCLAAGLGDDLPVVCIDWFEAVEFCNRLSDREGLDRAYEVEGEEVIWHRTANGYRLPTEAEWEYAARAGTRFTWVGTNRVEEVCEYANVGRSFPCEDSFPQLAPVSAFESNRWKLFGLGGNAAEWVWDAYRQDAGNAENDGVLDGDRASYRVIRGGSWRLVPRNARVANRGWDGPSRRNDDVGFRVARSLPSAL